MVTERSHDRRDAPIELFIRPALAYFRLYLHGEGGRARIEMLQGIAVGTNFGLPLLTGLAAYGAWQMVRLPHGEIAAIIAAAIVFALLVIVQPLYALAMLTIYDAAEAATAD